jgi:hypothetical protein
MKLHGGWLTGCFGSLFGCAIPDPYDNPIDSLFAASDRYGRFQQNSAMQQNLFLQQPTRTLPPGIFWERTGGKTHRVVIRRGPEVVIDLSNLGAV